MAKARSLASLHLSKNHLTTLPPLLLTHNAMLTTFAVAKNSVQDVPSGFFAKQTELRVLSLVGNQLTRLPPDLSSVGKTLFYLSVGYNQITELPPDSFRGMRDLGWLDISQNPLSSTLPDRLFDDLPALRALILDRLPLTTLTAAALAGLNKLVVLSLQQCWQLTEIPSGLLANCPQLVWLEINGAKGLTQLPMDLLQATPNLTTLNISDNALDGDYSSLLAPLTKLTSFNGSFNPKMRLDTYDWHTSSMKTLGLSDTAVRPLSIMCRKDISLQMASMRQANPEDLRAILAGCILKARVLDLSRNEALNNITLLQESLSPFFVTLTQSPDDTEGNFAIPAFQMQGSPVQCTLEASFRGRPIPTSLLNPVLNSYLSQDSIELPALEYRCACSPGYVSSKSGVCFLIWTKGRIAGVALGAIVLAAVIVA